MKKNTDTGLLENAKKYAEKVLKSSEMSEHYKFESDQELYDKAYLDYLTVPEVLGIFPGQNPRHKRKPIMIAAHEICKVKSVNVKLINHDGFVLEEGPAEQHYQKQKWYYLPKELWQDRMAIIEATAEDMAGNTGVMKIEVTEPLAEVII